MKRLLTQQLRKPWILVFILICLTMTSWGYGQETGHGLLVTPVALDRDTITPGESVTLSFSTNMDANVTVLVYTPDFDVVRHLWIDRLTSPGIGTVSWDGRDDTGRMVPNEAYMFGISARSGDQTVTWDASHISGGETVQVDIQSIASVNGKTHVTYSVPVSARVSLRAGIHQGPLLKTLIDWLPLPSGNFSLEWDGRDETGNLKVMETKDAHLYFKAFALPGQTVIVQDSTQDYLTYRKKLEGSSIDQGVSYNTTRHSAYRRISQGVSAQYLVKRTMNVAPVFKVFLEDDLTQELAVRPVQTVTGNTNLVIVVSSESLEIFNETRFEIIVFADHNRFDEEEHAHSPYTYTLNTRDLSNGLHWITINQASLTGQVGSYSFQTRINN